LSKGWHFHFPHLGCGIPLSVGGLYQNQHPCNSITRSSSRLFMNPHPGSDTTHESSSHYSFLAAAWRVGLTPMGGEGHVHQLSSFVDRKQRSQERHAPALLVSSKGLFRSISLAFAVLSAFQKEGKEGYTPRIGFMTPRATRSEAWRLGANNRMSRGFRWYIFHPTGILGI